MALNHSCTDIVHRTILIAVQAPLYLYSTSLFHPIHRSLPPVYSFSSRYAMHVPTTICAHARLLGALIHNSRLLPILYSSHINNSAHVTFSVLHIIPFQSDASFIYVLRYSLQPPSVFYLFVLHVAYLHWCIHPRHFFFCSNHRRYLLSVILSVCRPFPYNDDR